MGGVVGYDSRLKQLALLSELGHELACRLQWTTLRLQEAPGHILALNDEYVWRRLKHCALNGVDPLEGGYRLGVRCMVCSAACSLADWEQCALLHEGDRREQYEKIRATHGAAAGAFLLQCVGPAIAAYVRADLDTLVQSYRDHPVRRA